GVEGVFEIEYAAIGGSSIWTSDPASKTRGDFIAQEIMPQNIGGWGEMTPTMVLLNKFLAEPDKDGNFDPRATASLAWDYPGCTYYQRDFHTTWPGQVLLKKGQNWWNKDEGNWISSLNEFGMRYADVLLMLAETYTMKGDVASAAPLVQRVRTRANLVDKTVAMTAYTADQMMVEIKHQRDLEFAREGLHFYDLRRWGDIQSVITAAKKIGYLNWAAKFEYYPIPLAELQTNTKMTQSTAWQ
ncbi:MAG TPA: RagB/SusD family nutrient uptake outer membrane protein, partial [Bacteroidales bacterium]